MRGSCTSLPSLPALRCGGSRGRFVPAAPSCRLHRVADGLCCRSAGGALTVDFRRSAVIWLSDKHTISGGMDINEMSEHLETIARSENVPPSARVRAIEVLLRISKQLTPEDAEWE